MQDISGLFYDMDTSSPKVPKGTTSPRINRTTNHNSFSQVFLIVFYFFCLHQAGRCVWEPFCYNNKLFHIKEFIIACFYKNFNCNIMHF